MKKTLVVGLGKSGIAASRLLKAEKRSIFITEAKDTELIRSSIKDLIKDNVVQKNNIEIGKHTDRFLKDCNLLVVSPGVKSDSLPIKLAEDKNIPIIGELELAYSLCPAPIIAVTGTSGKTTVTTLIGSMLKASGRDVIVCGNIGTPLSSELKRIKKDSIVVLEVSSFQLERIKNFKPKISVILNISENHLDRHKDMEEYISLKMKIFSNQDKRDILFLNGRDKSLKGFIRDIKPKVEFFDEYKDFKKTYNIENENYLASMAVSSLEGVDEKTMLDVLLGFKGIEHRLEYVTAINGVDFINDSKATTISSVEWALKSLDPRIILIMGGRYKGGDFSRLKDLIEKKVDHVIAIGEARSRIKDNLSSFKEVIEEESLDKAVRIAFEKSKRSTKILLSPGCSSFDMFKNYEERGAIFKELCKKL